jgi:hypothetical protein
MGDPLGRFPRANTRVARKYCFKRNDYDELERRDARASRFCFLVFSMAMTSKSNIKLAFGLLHLEFDSAWSMRRKRSRRRRRRGRSPMFE